MWPSGEYDWTCAFFGPPESTTQTANRSIQPFLHSSRQKVSILYNRRPFPPKLPLLVGASGPPSNSWFLGPVQAYNSNGITISSAVFAQMTTVSLYFTMGRLFPPPLKIAHSHAVQPFLQASLVWQTDRPHYSVNNNRPHLRTYYVVLKNRWCSLKTLGEVIFC